MCFGDLDAPDIPPRHKDIQDKMLRQAWPNVRFQRLFKTRADDEVIVMAEAAVICRNGISG